MRTNKDNDDMSKPKPEESQLLSLIQSCFALVVDVCADGGGKKAEDGEKQRPLNEPHPTLAESINACIMFLGL